MTILFRCWYRVITFTISLAEELLTFTASLVKLVLTFARTSCCVQLFLPCVTYDVTLTRTEVWVPYEPGRALGRVNG